MHSDTITPEMEASGAMTQELLDAMQAQAPSTRLGRAEDIAATVAMLLSEDRRWINGQVFNVNGGGLMR